MISKLLFTSAFTKRCWGPTKTTCVALCFYGLILPPFSSALAAAPNAVDDTFDTASATAITDYLSPNDLNLDGPSDTYAKLIDPANGSVVINTDGSFTYTPNIGFAGIDQFSYSIDDGAGGSDTALVDVTVASSSNFLSTANPFLITLEDTSVPLGLNVTPDLFDGGALLDIISSEIGFRADTAGATPTVFNIPAGTSNIVVTGFSTQFRDTAGANTTDDDYQLLNARIDLTRGISSGRVAFINHGRLTELDQYAWEQVTLGQAVLADPAKVIGYHAREASNPIFKITGGALQVIESHTLETAYHVEFMTSDGDSTNFIKAGNTVQTAGVNTSTISLPALLEPASGKKGIIILNGLSAAAGSNSSVEHKGLSHLVIDLDTGKVSGSIAAQQGETSANTVTYGFRDYPLVDLRVGGSPTTVLSGGATVIGDTTGNDSVRDDPTIYIDAAGDLVIVRSTTFADTFTSMYTAEFYERTGYSSIASFVSVSSDDAFFDASPVDGVDTNGKPIDELFFEVPASARVGIFQGSWDTTGGSDTNENIGMGFAIIDLSAGTSSGALTFIRTSTPDLLAWDSVPFGQSYFGATDGGGNALYQSNKTANSFTDVFVENAAFTLITNTDGSRSLKFTASSNGGSQNYRDYQGNAQVSWLGNEPFQISGVGEGLTGSLSHGSPTASGGWEIDFSEIPLLSYIPDAHDSGLVELDFSLSSTGEAEIIEVNIEPVTDAPTLSASDAVGYSGVPLAIISSVVDSADVDGSESQLSSVDFSGVPASVILNSASGSVIDNGGGNWTISVSALPNLLATGSAPVTTSVTIEGLNTDSDDIDGDTSIEDSDNGSSVDEYDELLVQTTFNLIISEIPTVTSLLTGNGAPTISGTATPGIGETLTVTVNGVTYTAGDSNLTDNSDGTWDLIIPAADTLAEGTYTVVAQLSHTGGATGVDSTANELIVDLTPPPAPGVTSQTTQDTTPVISGTTTIGSNLTLTVAVNGVTYTAGDGNLIDNGDGTWDLAIPAANVLPEAMYQVDATLTDTAGNSSSDSGNNELLVDLTAPPSPGVTSLTTNNVTPVISGTATVGVGDILTVEVNSVIYIAGDGNLVDNADGTWDLTIPTANVLAEATYDVTATVTDAALNAGTDPSNQELVVDTTAPAAPAVIAQTTGSGTPVISGTATVNSGEILTVDVNGITYTAGDGNLIDNGDSTWDLTIPSADSLAEDTYDVTATVTDAAGNTSTDASTNELIIDLTPPAAPSVTFQLTNNPTPVISGSATLAAGDTLSITVNGVTYDAGDGDLIDNGNGTWDLTIPAGDTLIDASYDVTATVADIAGNSAVDATSPDLVVDLTPPPAPGVTSQTTQNQTPVISGTTTIGSGLTLSVTVNTKTYIAGDGKLIDNGDGTWDLTIPAGDLLPEATYDVLATLTDAAGNASSDSGSSELVVDITAPPTPGVTSLTTNDTTPTVSGTAIVNSGDALTVEINSVVYTAGDGNLVDNGDGTWDLTIPVSGLLPEATYDVTATVTDNALNTSSDPSSQELLVDTTAPAAPTVIFQTTNTGTPVISGTATVNAGEVLSVAVNGITYTAGDGNLVNNGDGTWGLTIPATDTLIDATYDVTAIVTDGAGNTSNDSSVAELVIDLVPPPAPVVTFQLTNIATPVISGTAILTTGDTLSATVNGIIYTEGDGKLVNNGDGTWDLTIPASDSLTDASYDVTTTVTDIAGNTTIDATNPDLVIDLTPPPAPGVTSQTTQDQTPVISGTTTVSTGLILTVTVNTKTYTAGDSNLVDNGDGTWDLTIPAGDLLPEAIYDVLATLTDAAGNASSDSGSSELVVDITAPPSPGVTSLTTNDTTPTLSGTAIVNTNDTLTVEVNSIIYTAGDGNLTDNGDGTWDLTIPVANILPESIYNVTATVTDLALNISTDPSNQELLVDTTAPAAPAVTSQTINTGVPVISGTATVIAGEVLTVLVNGITYTAGDGNLVDNGDGTWDLTIPASNTLPEAIYEVDVTVTDGAGNTSSDSSASELIIDLVAPPAPAVTYQLTNNTIPGISGAAATTTDDTLTVDVNGVIYIAGDGNLIDNGNGSWDLTIPLADALTESIYDITATITDLAGNTAVDVTNPDLVVDLTPPPAPGVTSQTTQNQTPLISGTTTVGSGLALTVTVNTKMYSSGDGNLIDNGDGTWDLTIPAGDLLPEATYDVFATLTDAAGNASSDSSSSELVVDTTAPPTPGVTSLTTNDTTPTLSGTAIVNVGDTLTVEVNSIIYTAGDGNLIDHSDGTWDLTIPASDILSEATYDVTAAVTDIALNTSNDPGSLELLVDTTAPTAPVVATQTTNTGTPVISGTATVSPDEVLTVEVNSIIYTAGDGNLIDNTDGTWDLTIPAANTLPEATYNVTAKVADVAGNFTTDSSIDELIIDLTAPLTLAVNIDEDTDNNGLIAAAESAGDADVTLTLPAGAATGDTINVTDGITVTAIVLTTGDIANGSVATSFATPADGIMLNIDATLTDIAGNISPNAQDIATVDFTATSAPGVSITEDTNNDALINLAELTGPVDIRVSLPGDVVAGDQLIIDINGTQTAITLSGVHIGAGSYSTQTTSPGDGGSVQVDTWIVDMAGNVSAIAIDMAVLDLTAPVVPTVISQISNSPTPVINGSATVNSADGLTVLVDGVNYLAGDGNLVNNGDSTWTLTIPATQAVVENTFEVIATVTDNAGNPTSDATSTELIVDLTAPVVPAVTSQTTNTATPVISGTATVGSGETLTVTVSGITYTAGDGNLVNNGDGTWDLTIPATNPLPDASYEVLVTVTDAAGNSTSDSSATELVIDLIAPVVPTVTAQTTNTGTPVISGSATIDTSEILTVTVNGATYTAGDGNLVVNPNATWDLTIPVTDTLTDATYEVTATVTDQAGNSTTDVTSDELIIDLFAPVAPTVTAQTINSGTPVISGTATVASDESLTVAVNGVTYTEADGNLINNGDGTWDLTIPAVNTLPDATYDVDATVTDDAGNSTTDSTTTELIIDLVAPVTPTVISQTINTGTPVISGTATVGSDETLTIVVNGITYTAGDGNLIDHGDATWDLTIPVTDTLPEAVYDVTATVSDIAGNATIDITNPDLTIDLTPPPAPGVTSQTTQNQTPVISGTTTVGTGLTLTVNVNGITYTAGDGILIDNADGTWDLTIPAINLLPEATYEVLAILTDVAGNTNTDPGSNDLVVDITAPPTPGVTSLTTNNTTPVINGTAIVGTGDTLTVEVNSIIYTAGDGNLVDNTNGTWNLTIPTADVLPEAIYDVTAVITDLALNTSTDPGSLELLVDTTAPVAPAVTSQTINTGTPVISGTATINPGELLTVVVNGITYTAGDGNLIDNGDGTWDLSIPAVDTLTDATYDVIVTVTDTAGNSTTDSSATELVIDLLAPVAPAVAPQTTNTGTPAISGTATIGNGETLTVVVNGVTYTAGDGDLIDNGDGTWDLTIPATDTLADATYDVIVTVTDTAGNITTDSSASELVIDLLAPVAPTVTAQTVNTGTPVISGTATVGSGETLTVALNGSTYTAGDGNLIDNGDGTWDLTIPVTDILPEAIYDVTAMVVDIAGNTTSDVTNPDLTIDLTPPPAPVVTSQTTQNQTPVISGTTPIESGLTLTVTVNDVSYTAGDGNLIDNADGTWDLTIPIADLLPEATYEVVANLTDVAGNTSTDPGSNELVVDITAPPTPGVTSLTTNNTTPVISGTAIVAATDTLTVEVNGIIYSAGDGNLVDNTDGTWDLTIPVSNVLAEATYDVTAVVTDPALNTSTDPGSLELLVDTTAPVAPAVTSQTINTGTPVISGTAIVSNNETLTVAVNGNTYTAGDGNLLDNGDGTWDLTIPATNALPEAVYDVTVTVTDVAGNITSDITNTDLTIDLTPPPAPGVTSQTTQDQTPVISGTTTVGTGLTLTVTVNSVTYTAGDGSLIDNADSTWDLSIPAAENLPEAIYEVIATLTDNAGNASADPGNNELVVDITAPPTPGVTSLTTNDTTPVINGTAIVGANDTLIVEVNGIVYSAGDGNLTDNANGTWTLTIPAANAVPEAIYDVTATVTDLALNSSTDPSGLELLVDTTAPVAPAVVPQTSNTSTPIISGTATVAPSETLTVSVNGITYTAGDGNLTDNGDGTWDLVIPTANALPEGPIEVQVTVTDAAGNTTSDGSIAELLIDLTPPTAPTIIAQVTSATTPVVHGTAIVNANESLSVEINGVTYTTGDGNLSDNGDDTWTLMIPATDTLTDSTYNVTAIVTDIAGNITSDATVTELIIDSLAPTVPSVIQLITSNNTPTLSGSAIVSPDEILTVEINGVIYTAGDGSLTDNGNGTWDLDIPATDALPDGSFDVTVAVTDPAGNTTADTSASEVTIDTTPPPAPGVTSQTTLDTTPTISGTVANTILDNTLILTVEVNGITYTEGDGNLIDNGDGTWDLSIHNAEALPEDIYNVTATLTDSAGNSSTDPGSSELVVDLTAPATPGVTSLSTRDVTPVINGTANINAGDVLSVQVNGITYIAGDGNLATNNDDTWSLTIPVINALAENTYDVTAITTDIAGNTSTDPSITELLVDLTTPIIPLATTQVSSTATPIITGTANLAPGEVLSVTIDGVTYIDGDGNLAYNADGTWALAIPQSQTMPDGVFVMQVTITDTAGNVSVNNIGETLTIDTNYPTLDAQTTDTFQTNVPTFGGISSEADGSIVTITDQDGNVLCSAIVVNGKWTCTSTIALPDGVTDLIASTTDAAGNRVEAPFTANISSDFDGDGIPNSVEGNGDSDGDGVSDAIDLDSDNDGIADIHESQIDTDSDGVPNYLDPDSDNDGIPDTLEAIGTDRDRNFLVDNFIDINRDGLSDPLQNQDSQSIPDTDYDGIPDYMDLDSDQDGVPDIIEADGTDANSDGRIDQFTDLNGDGIDDSVFLLPTVPRDTDDDGTKDYLDRDSDNDGRSDLIESGSVDHNNDGAVDSMTDTDRDSIPDSVDVTQTLGVDNDNDGIDDRFDASILQLDDADGDGIADRWDPDADGDGFADTIVNGITFARALPDENDNGIDDLLEPQSGAIRTGLQGYGGCVISSGAPTMTDPTIPAILLLSGLVVAARRGRSKSL